MRGVATAESARWDASHGVFIYEGRSIPPSLAPFRAQPYSWEMRVQHELADTAPPSTAPRSTIELRTHQTSAVQAILSARAAKLPGFLLADDVGLGKTISAWAAILQMRDVESVLIVCPLSVVPHWRRTIEAMGDGGKQIVVMNYDRLGKLFEISDAARKKVRTKKGLARAGTAPDTDVIVLDESHRCKNPTAARSKLAAQGVTINNLLPGAFETDRLRVTMQGAASKSGQPVDAIMDARRKTIPARRFGTPEEFGAICAFLCSTHAAYITGQNVLADGGAYPGTY